MENSVLFISQEYEHSVRSTFVNMAILLSLASFAIDNSVIHISNLT